METHDRARLRPQIVHDGSLQFVANGGLGGRGVVMVLSRGQVRLLVALAGAAGGQLPLCAVHALVQPAAGEGTPRAPLTNAQRAALSRSLRRLRARGLIEPPARTGVGLTAEGRRLVDWLMSTWDGWRVYSRHFPPTFTGCGASAAG